MRRVDSVRLVVSRTLVVSCVLALLTGSPVARAAQKISYRQITRTHPIAVQRGQVAKVRVWSNFSLSESHPAFFVPGGIRMTELEKSPRKIDFFEPAELDQGEAFGYRVEVPESQLPGVYEYRIATAQAVSSVGHLLVTDYPVVVEKQQDNNKPATAQPVAVPSAVCGAIESFEDIDLYRIHGRAGQNLVCQIFAQRVTRAIHCMAIQYPKIHLMDSYLTLRDEKGRVVAENDNHVGGDAMLCCRLPASGDYFLEVRDSRFAGDPRYVYCVEVTERAVPLATFPVAVRRGETLRAEVVTSRADHSTGGAKGTKTDRTFATWDAASNMDVGWRRVRVPGSDGQPGGVVDQLVSDAFQMESGSQHNTLDRAEVVRLPVGISGRFERPGQVHYYVLAAQAGDVIRIDMQSRRRGWAVDGHLAVMTRDGAILASADDGPFTKDPTLRFQAASDGRFVVAVRDLNRRAGERFIYHLSLEKSGPDFEIHGEYYYGMLSPGTHAAWFVRLNRLNGFRGPVEVLVDRLPDGVRCEPVTIPAGANHCALVFSADVGAKQNASLVRVRGRARVKTGGQELIREAHVLGELRRAGASRFVRMPIQSQLLAVTKRLDLHAVVATPAELEIPRGGEATLEVRIKRSPEYTEQVLLDMALMFFNKAVGQQLPPGVSVKGQASHKLTGKTLKASFTLQASPTATAVTSWPITVIARVPITYTIMTPYASNPVFLTVK